MIKVYKPTEVKQAFASVIDEVIAGETVKITRRNRTVVMITEERFQNLIKNQKQPENFEEYETWQTMEANNKGI